MQLALQIVLIISSVLLVLLILLHRGRGGGLSTLFGGGVQSSLSGSSVVEKQPGPDDAVRGGHLDDRDHRYGTAGQGRRLKAVSITSVSGGNGDGRR